MSRRTRKGAIIGAFIAHPLEMRLSPAWRALPDDARRVLMRLEQEHMQHGGACNGSLTCTYADFVADGIGRTAIPRAIRRCVALGFLEITRKGRPSISNFRAPSQYRLTYLAGRDRSPDPTHEWRCFSIETARAALAKAEAPPEAQRPGSPRKAAPIENIDSRPPNGLGSRPPHGLAKCA